MKYKGLVVMAVIAILSVSMAFAYRGNYESTSPNYSEASCTEMSEAFESNDYAAWKQLMSDKGVNSRVLQLVNEDNFHVFVEAREAGKSGNYKLSQQLRAELGLNNGIAPKDGVHKNTQNMQQKQMMRQQRLQ